MTATASKVLDRVLVLEMVRVTEAAAIAASKLIGRGDEKAADAAAVEAMRAALNELYMDGTVVIGEGERDEAPMLFIGEKVGAATGKARRSTSRSIRSKARRSAPRPGRTRWRCWRSPRRAACSTRPTSIWTRSRSARAIPTASSTSTSRRPRMSTAVAAAKGVEPHEIIVCVLDRPRHEELIAELRAVGCGIMLIGDGDVAGVIATTNPDTDDRHLHGLGRRARGRAGGAALRCVGGQFKGRLLFRNDDERGRARANGASTDLDKHLRPDRAGQGRLHLRRDRRDRRLAARRASSARRAR